MKQKYYAVRKGRQTGIYQDWDSCKTQVDGFAGAQYKSFSTREEAARYLEGQSPAPAASAPRTPREPSVSPPIPAGHVVIYADGACSGNPGRGGYGTVILHGGQRRELSDGFRRTTNNRMEILGCIAGLDAIEERSDITLYSDSKYVVDTITKGWAETWRGRGWNRKVDGELVPASNADLWARMLDLCEWHRVRFQWVRGHDGNVENERCDELARAAAASENLQVDVFYEKSGG
jgi:ribonuclease HI